MSLTSCGLLLRSRLLRSGLLLGPSLLGQLAPHTRAAQYGQQLVEGAVGLGCLVGYSSCRALRFIPDTLTKPENSPDGLQNYPDFQEGRSSLRKQS